jgi:hypothetical protein
MRSNENNSDNDTEIIEDNRSRNKLLLVAIIKYRKYY